MAVFFKKDYLPAAGILVISLFYWLGIISVPFHPDESTQLYMAADLKTLFTHPADLVWTPEKSGDLRQYYRDVDPPLSRYLIGLGLAIGGQDSLTTDWDWSMSYAANQTAGALPSTNQLLAGRLAVAILFPFSLMFAYWIGKTIHSRPLGWLLFLLVAVNALVLIHTRRAMAESALLFGILFSLWAILTWKRNLFLLAIPIALAFNAKYSPLPLLLIGAIAIWWDKKSPTVTLPKKLLHTALYCLIFLGITFLLNPFLWRSPLPALKDAIGSRSRLVDRQNELFTQLAPRLVMTGAGEKSVGLLSQIFFAPPAIQDVGNYTTDLRQAAENYSANSVHTFMRGWIGGVVILFLTLVGLVVFLVWLVRTKPLSRSGVLFLAAFLLQFITTLVIYTFPFQRYYLPLVPYTCFWLAFSILFPIERMYQRKTAQRESNQGQV